MKILVLGASGKVGRLVVEKLLAEGHQVTVFVHSSGSFSETSQLKVVKGDVHDGASVKRALTGCDMVVSTLGSWGTKQKDILSSAMEHVVPAMQEQGITRIVTLTGSAAQAPGDVISTGNKISHAVFGLVAKPILKDGEAHLRMLAKSELNWTSLRAGIMKNGSETTYVLNDKLPGAVETVTRATVARAIVDQLTAADHIQRAPHLHGN